MINTLSSVKERIPHDIKHKYLSFKTCTQILRSLEKTKQEDILLKDYFSRDNLWIKPEFCSPEQKFLVEKIQRLILSRSSEHLLQKVINLLDCSKKNIDKPVDVLLSLIYICALNDQKKSEKNWLQPSKSLKIIGLEWELGFHSIVQGMLWFCYAYNALALLRDSDYFSHIISTISYDSKKSAYNVPHPRWKFGGKSIFVSEEELDQIVYLDRGGILEEVPIVSLDRKSTGFHVMEIAFMKSYLLFSSEDKFLHDVEVQAAKKSYHEIWDFHLTPHLIALLEEGYLEKFFDLMLEKGDYIHINFTPHIRGKSSEWSKVIPDLHSRGVKSSSYLDSEETKQKIISNLSFLSLHSYILKQIDQKNNVFYAVLQDPQYPYRELKIPIKTWLERFDIDGHFFLPQ